MWQELVVKPVIKRVVKHDMELLVSGNELHIYIYLIVCV